MCRLIPYKLLKIKRMKKSSLYTRGGDRGTTSLVGGQRITKGDTRLESYGTIDELNSFLGLLITETDDPGTTDILLFVQHRLFSIGSYLATDTTTTALRPADHISTNDIERLEQKIDEMDSGLPKMKGFILPGGCRSASLAHVCRTICRRAERQICRLSETTEVATSVLTFINRLSDLLFVIARNECLLKNKEEIIRDNACY